MRLPVVLTLSVLGILLLLSIHVARSVSPRSHYALDDFLKVEFDGTRDGIVLKFPAALDGEVVYGSSAPGRYPYPMYRYRDPLEGGIANVWIEGLPYIGRSGVHTFTFKVINTEGRPIFYGEVQVRRDPRTDRFQVLRGSVICGPFVYCPRPDRCVIRYRTLEPVRTELVVRRLDGGIVTRLEDGKPRTVHEFRVAGLRPDTEYELIVRWNGFELVKRRFRTAVPDGDAGFTFAFASDSRC
ncbi:hypothetical protein, partial [Methanopyrus kandleri]